MICYFAYGSNLHPMRLLERIPSANLISVVELKNYRLTFHKKSTDGSAKCNLLETGESSDSVHGVIYEIKPEHKEKLDGFEGKGQGYTDNQIRFQVQEQEYNCFTYLAQQSHIVDSLKPYHWYKEMVILGAKYLKFPDSYVSSIELVESWGDQNEKRRNEKEVLLQAIRNYR